MQGLVARSKFARLSMPVAAVPEALAAVRFNPMGLKHMSPYRRARGPRKAAVGLGADKAGLGGRPLGVLRLMLTHIEKAAAQDEDAILLAACRHGIGEATRAAVPKARRPALRVVDASSCPVAFDAASLCAMSDGLFGGVKEGLAAIRGALEAAASRLHARAWAACYDVRLCLE